MFKIGNIGVAAVKNRLAVALGPTDSSEKPLTKRYAIQETKLGKGNRRNLFHRRHAPEFPGQSARTKRRPATPLAKTG
jgi:hypothetical protein